MFYIETARTYIRAPQKHDFEDLYKLQTDPEVMRVVGIGKPRSLEEVQKSLKNSLWHQQKYGYSLGSVFEKSSDKFIGRAGLIHLAFGDNSPDIEIAYALHKNYWHKGYATEIAKALIEWGFENLSAAKLVGITRLDNKASQRVLEKAGMRYNKKYLYNGIETSYYEILKINYEKTF